MNESPLRIAPGLTRHHNRLVLVAALLLSFTPPAWSDVLIGYYTINAKYNTADVQSWQSRQGRMTRTYTKPSSLRAGDQCGVGGR